mmetsp:Transcript_36772/g.105905  ORF Transcript_36772/g.105905 Transcript_36772/m.105905 type:complete len:530 (+) Transcript_36772:318-1907(+)
MLPDRLIVAGAHSEHATGRSNTTLCTRSCARGARGALGALALDCCRGDGSNDAPPGLPSAAVANVLLALPLGKAGDGLVLACTCEPGPLCGVARKAYGEGGADTDCRGDLDSAAVNLRDAHGDGEPEPNALKAPRILVLLLLKGVEDPRERLGGNALPGVRNIDQQHAGRCVLPGAQADGPAWGELRGVRDEVVQELRDLIGVAKHDWELSRAHAILHAGGAAEEGAAALVDGHLRHADHLVHDIHHVNRLLLDGLGAGGLKLLGLGHLHDVRDEVQEASGATTDHAQVPLLRRRRLIRHRAAQADDAVQRAAELVAKHCSDLLLPRLDRLHRPYLGEVLPDARDCPPLVVAQLDDECQQHLHRAVVLGLAPEHDLHGAGALAASAAAEGRAQHSTTPVLDEVEDARAHGLRLRDAGESREVFVPGRDYAVLRHREDRGAGIAEDAAHVLLAGLNGALHTIAQRRQLFPVPDHHQHRRLDNLDQHVADGVDHLLGQRAAHVLHPHEVEHAVTDKDGLLEDHRPGLEAET